MNRRCLFTLLAILTLLGPIFAQTSDQLSLELKISSYAEEIVEVFSSQEPSIGVIQELDISDAVNSAFQRGAQQALDNPELIDEQGRIRIQIETPVALSVSVPKNELAQVTSSLEDNQSIVMGYSLGKKLGQISTEPWQQFDVNGQIAQEAQQRLISGLSDSAFVADLSIELAIPLDAPAQNYTMIISYFIASQE